MPRDRLLDGLRKTFRVLFFQFFQLSGLLLCLQLTRTAVGAVEATTPSTALSHANDKALLTKEPLKSNAFAKLTPGEDDAPIARLTARVHSIDRAVGGLTVAWAKKTGLQAGIPVAVGAFDAHLGAVIQSTPAGQQITVVTSDPGDVRLVAGDRDITVVAI